MIKKLWARRFTITVVGALYMLLAAVFLTAIAVTDDPTALGRALPHGLIMVLKPGFSVILGSMHFVGVCLGG